MNYVALDECNIILTVKKSPQKKFNKRIVFFLVELVTNRTDSNEMNTEDRNICKFNSALQYSYKSDYKCIYATKYKLVGNTTMI